MNTRYLRLTTAVALVVALAGTDLTAQSRSAAASVNRNTHAHSNTNLNSNTTFNREQTVNVTPDVNLNVNRHVDVNVNRGYYGGYGCCYNPHPVATAAAVTTAAVVTAAAIGSIVHTLPPACTVVVVGNVSYQQCGSTWYQPQFVGTSVQYVVVTAPR